MMAFVILLLVLVPVSMLLTNVMSQASSARERLTALSLSEKCVEILDNQSPPLDPKTNLPDTNVTQKATQCETGGTTTVAGITYSLYSLYNWTTAEGGVPNLCTSGTVPEVLRLKVTASWKSSSLDDSTVLDYPPASIQTDGFLGVQVNGDTSAGTPQPDAHGAWSDRVQSVPVTITSVVTPPATATVYGPYYPDQYGCAFAELPPGTYTVAVDDPTPGQPIPLDQWGAIPYSFVTSGEQASATQTDVEVSLGKVQLVGFQYDEGTMVDLQYPSTTAVENGVSCPATGQFLCAVSGESAAPGAAPNGAESATLSVQTPSGWSTAQVPDDVARIEATACAGTTRCVSVGWAHDGAGGSEGASLSAPPGSPGDLVADTLPSGVTELTEVVCPTSSSCVAIGSGPSGPVALTAAVTTGSVTWSLDSVPAGVTDLSNLVCSSDSTCSTVGATGTGVVILSLAGTTWVPDTLPDGVTLTSLNGLTCAGSGTTPTCYADGTGIVGLVPNGPVMLSRAAGSPWTLDTVTLTAGETASSLGQIECPAATRCYAVGSASSGPVVLSVDATGTNWIQDGLPADVTALSNLACTGPSDDPTCFATGGGADGAAILSLSSATAWQEDTLPSPGGHTPDLVEHVACTGPTNCFATAVSQSSGTGFVLSNSGGTSWTTDSLPAPIVFFSGLGCSSTSCVVAGATQTSAVILDSPDSGATWTHGTPGGLSGMYLNGIPITLGGLTNPLEVSAPASPPAPVTDPSEIGPLFPLATGYTVAAGDCKAQPGASAAIATVPGTTTAAVLPMGLLPIEVVSAAGGLPISGAQVTASVDDADCVPLTPPPGTTNPTSYTLQTTGPDGLSRLAVIYQTYDVTVTAGDLTGTTTVTVTPTGLLAGGNWLPAPTPVVVPVS